MDAQVLSLDRARSERSFRTLYKRYSLMPKESDGLDLILNAASFSVRYVAVIASFHLSLLSAAWSPWLKERSHLASK